MLEPKQLHGLRIVARPAALDSARYEAIDHDDPVVVLRIASDDVFAINAASVTVDDHYAIIETESAFTGTWMTYAQFDATVRHHIEWQLPAQRPALAQGLAATLPIKLYLDVDRVMVIVSRGLVHEAQERFV